MAAVSQLRSLRVLHFSASHLLKAFSIRLRYEEEDRSLTFPDSLTDLLISTTDFKGLILPSFIQSLILAGLKSDIVPGIIPTTLTSLKLNEFNNKIEAHSLPNGLKNLDVGHRFNQVLDKGSLPKSITKLSLGISFKQQCIDQHHLDILPASLVHLEFLLQHKHLENVIMLEEIESPLPASLTSLILSSFNSPIRPGLLPSNLKSLNLGPYFNHPILPGSLPEALTSITLGNRFDRPIKLGVLPNSLKRLLFGNSFNHMLTVDVFPNSLESLFFGLNFDKLIKPGVLPQGITSLHFGYYFGTQLVTSYDVLPSSLTTLDICQYLDNAKLPESITKLVIRRSFKHQLHGHLPNLTHLTLPSLDDYLMSNINTRLQLEVVDLRGDEIPLKRLKKDGIKMSRPPILIKMNKYKNKCKNKYKMNKYKNKFKNQKYKKK
ncbi:hypothetical protein SAMD00019534_062680 [Acytostelium subglobosum LB1]|uniref:hypothetical protein n=1 Tax=Acytostelium subglobosum LB1 TaxID=1410327 RepID=UPI0006451D17|nr:hypothetical protein SAMD00019534_062680 [Acytostelium subglobosum LB1]GAM23093.1 hypothetical protein SAMD00019534_062680 [Acytostelium subglobosum LB1]|eukprot:XP_012754320.1 hypothetical protein SAMD00019534_062680 [Acytostelium subglobosum LB1]